MWPEVQHQTWNGTGRNRHNDRIVRYSMLLAMRSRCSASCAVEVSYLHYLAWCAVSNADSSENHAPDHMPSNQHAS